MPQNHTAISSRGGIRIQVYLAPNQAPLLAASYLFHGAVQNLLPEAHLDSNHEGSGSSRQFPGSRGPRGCRCGPSPEGRAAQQWHGCTETGCWGQGTESESGAGPGPPTHATSPPPAIDSSCSMLAVHGAIASLGAMPVTELLATRSWEGG